MCRYILEYPFIYIICAIQKIGHNLYPVSRPPDNSLLNIDHWAVYLEIGKGVALCTCCSPVPRQSLFPPYLAFSTVAAASKAGFELPTYR